MTLPGREDDDAAVAPSYRDSGLSWLRPRTKGRRKRACVRARERARANAYILHELLADGADVLGQSGGEHHHLFLVRGQTEDVLHVSTHVCRRKVKWENNQLRSFVFF